MEMTKRKKQAIETKLRITKCALELYKEMGSDEVKVSDICELANVSIGAFYHHFTSKDDIIQNAYASLDDLVVAKIQDESFDSYMEKTVAIFRGCAAVSEEYGYNFVTEAYKVMLINHDDATFSKDRSSFQLVVECMQKAKENGELHTDRDPYEIAEYLFRLGRGMLFDWCLRLGSYDIKDAMEEEIRFTLPNLNQNH